MGLSDEERLSKVVATVHYLTDLLRDAENLDDRLSAEIEKLYELYLSGDCNGGYWIMGGDVTKQHQGCDPSSPIGEALEASAQLLLKGNSWEPAKAQSHDAWWFNYSYLSIEKLLGRVAHDGGNLRVPFLAYNAVENYLYASNRYKDELAEKLAPLSKQMSRIAMISSKLLRSDNRFYRAWAINQAEYYLLDPWEAYGEEKVKDPVVRWWIDENLQHSVGVGFSSAAELEHLLQEVRHLRDNFGRDLKKRKDIGVQIRVEMTLLLVWRGEVKYPHKLKKLLEICEKWNKRRKKNRFDIKRIEQLWADYAERLKNEPKRPSFPDMNFCWIKDVLLPQREDE